MTDPTGHVFLSYKHEQKDVASFLHRELEEYGVPVWRDVFDLRAEPLRDEIIEQVENPETASGIVLVSPGVANSDIILNDELPGFKDRWDADDGFFVVVVPCPGVGVDKAKTILQNVPILHDFSAWKMEPLDDATPNEAADIVDTVLAERIEQIDTQLTQGEPIECSLDTYESPAHSIDPAIAIDWSRRFTHGPPSMETWHQRLLPALSTVTDQLNQNASGRPLRFRGRSHLPASFALGHCLQTTRHIPAAWMQHTADGNVTQWTLHDDGEDSGLDGNLQRRASDGSELAVLVNFNADVEPEIVNTQDNLPEFTAVLELTPEQGPDIHLTPAQATHAAKIFRNKIRHATKQLPHISTIHLFMAVPTGLAFLFGQQTNTLRPIQTYQHAKDEGRYYPAARLQNQPVTDE